MSAIVGNEFRLQRLRYTFEAVDRVRFAAMASNTLRGALGYALRDDSIFAPGAAGRHPSGLADLPRPFLFRSAHLDGATVEAGTRFHFGLHLFDTRRDLAPMFTEAFARMGQRGIGAGSGGLRLCDVDRVDVAMPLAPGEAAIETISVDFLTPTELKSRAAIAPEPLFPVLFARMRDRITTLSALYGDGPIEIDFRAMGERAQAVRMTASDIRYMEVTRRSTRTGQRHPIGGFLGTASYAGALTEFLPWLEAAAFTGVGRQTTWGKGEIRVRVS